MSEHLPLNNNPEQQPILTLESLSGELEGWLGDYQYRPEQMKPAIAEQITRLLESSEVHAALAAEQYTDETLEQHITTLQHAQEVTGQSYIQRLADIPEARLQRHFRQYTATQELFAQTTEQAMATDDTELKIKAARIFCYASGLAYGQPYEWRTENGAVREDLPAYMYAVAESDNLAYIALRAVPMQAEGETGGHFNDRLLQAGAAIFERCTPLTSDLSEKLRRSLEARSMKRNGDMVIPAGEPGSGVDYDNWFSNMWNAVEAVRGLSAADLTFLHQEAGIVNFDRYTNAQLQRTLRVLQNDSEEIARLQEKDVTLFISDTYGDYNNASLGLASAIESDDNILVCEVDNPLQLYRRPIAMIRRSGITPSGLFYAAHGSPGVIAWRGEGEQSDFAAISENPIQDSSDNLSNIITVSESQVARFLAKYLKPHSQTGERHITLASCEQAQAPHWGISIPEAILRQASAEDRLVVRAAAEKNNIRRNRDKTALIFANANMQQDIPAYEFRVSESTVWQGLKRRFRKPQPTVVVRQTDTIEYI